MNQKTTDRKSNRGLAFALLLMAGVLSSRVVFANDNPAASYDYKHWAFQPLTQTPDAEIQNANPIDHFIRVQQKERDLSPAPSASPRKLIRRVYFDLIGLPPTPEEVDAFAAHPTSAAYQKMIADLLGRSQYGERWARHWLDVARFAESHGFEQDYDRPYAYHYRDFVIRALNDDMPYNQFVQWQIAGDEMAPENGWANVATGFLGAGVFPTQLTEAEFESARYDELDDMVNTVGVGMLGLTVGCSRCHDHPYDPVTSQEYYQLTAAFATTIRSHAQLDLGDESYQYQKRLHQADHAKLVNSRDRYLKDKLPGELEKWLKATPQAKRKNIPDHIAALLDLPSSKWSATQRADVYDWFATVDATAKKQIKAVADSLANAPKPNAVKALVSSEGLPPLKHHADGRGYPHFYENVHVLKRGDPKLKQEIAKPGFPAVFAKATGTSGRWKVSPPKGARTSYRRRALAQWITDEQAGAGHLLARVIVNRLWQHHFGRGIVATPDDFGKQGAAPTHPKLLDYLATQLIKNDWRLKPIHMLILTSETYQQAMNHNVANESIDPDNQYFWRRDRIRLEGEAIRDTMLDISNTLDHAMFGPGSLDESHTRRSIYFFQKRSNLIAMMQAFDAPEALTCQGARPSTTVAPQSLMMLNNPNIRAYAQGLAKRALDESGGNVQAAVDRAYQYTLSRAPTSTELKDAHAFIADQQRGYDSEGQSPASVSPLADFCQVLMCLNEFLYID